MEYGVAYDFIGLLRRNKKVTVTAKRKKKGGVAEFEQKWDPFFYYFSDLLPLFLLPFLFCFYLF